MLENRYRASHASQLGSHTGTGSDLSCIRVRIKHGYNLGSATHPSSDHTLGRVRIYRVSESGLSTDPDPDTWSRRYRGTISRISDFFPKIRTRMRCRDEVAVRDRPYIASRENVAWVKCVYKK